MDMPNKFMERLASGRKCINDLLRLMALFAEEMNECQATDKAVCGMPWSGIHS